MAPFWFILLGIIWALLVLVSAFMTLMMFAFADSPGAGRAAKLMIGPIFIISLVIFATSGWLVWHGTWWSVGCAYALAISPPFLVFAGYNLLM